MEKIPLPTPRPTIAITDSNIESLRRLCTEANDMNFPQTTQALKEILVSPNGSTDRTPFYSALCTVKLNSSYVQPIRDLAVAAEDMVVMAHYQKMTLTDTHLALIGRCLVNIKENLLRVQHALDAGIPQVELLFSSTLIKELQRSYVREIRSVDYYGNDNFQITNPAQEVVIPTLSRKENRMTVQKIADCAFFLGMMPRDILGTVDAVDANNDRCAVKLKDNGILTVIQKFVDGYAEQKKQPFNLSPKHKKHGALR